ncbi:hypothetical protein [Peribacillus frigoritolerans]|uniref:hypothetical protein n=1 Tax=Peribacillus frigoritolerans TaxID=450367 RepID=UPI00382FAB17
MPKATKKEEKYIDLAITNIKTGEILSDLEEGDRIIKGSSRKAYIELKEKEKQKKKDRRTSLVTQGLFVQVLHNKDREIEKELTLPQCSLLLDLFFCVTEKSNNYIVHSSSEKKGEKMNQKDISLFLGKSERSTKQLLGEMVKLKALICEKNPRRRTENFYLLNSEFFTATRRKKKIKFTKMFHNKLKEVRTRLNDKHYGALLKFIRYFHYQTYYLVGNPDHNIIVDPELSIARNLLLEENELVLQHFNQTQLAKIIGITDDSTIRNYVKAYERAGAMMVLKQHKSYRFVIHPDLMFRKDGDGQDEYTVAIRAQFKQFDSKPKKKRK